VPIRLARSTALPEAAAAPAPAGESALDELASAIGGNPGQTGELRRRRLYFSLHVHSLVI
jgi:hypothetical protein